MRSTYNLAAKLLVRQAFKLLMGRFAWASFLGGPVGVVLSFILYPLLGWLASEGFLKLEFKRIDDLTGVDADRYKASIDKLNSGEEITKEEKAEIIAEVKKATEDFLSIKKYIRS